jgi:uncharacterized protein (TIGR02217 family)
MSFHEIRFPTGISFGATGGPERRTEIVTLGSGAEERNTPWAHSRRRYNAGYGLRSLDDVHEVIAFFEARRGRLIGFRWKDRADWKSCGPSEAIAADDQLIGMGDGETVTFQLVKTYASGAGGYVRPVTKPVAGSLQVSLGDVEQVLGTDFTLEATSGLVTFATAPGTDVEVKAGFAFDVPVRFDTDFLEVNLAGFEAGSIPAIPIVEVRV